MEIQFRDKFMLLFSNAILCLNLFIINNDNNCLANCCCKYSNKRSSTRSNQKHTKHSRWNKNIKSDFNIFSDNPLMVEMKGKKRNFI